MSTVKNPVVPPPSPKRKFKKRYILLGLTAFPFVFGMFIQAYETPEEKAVRIAQEQKAEEERIISRCKSNIEFNLRMETTRRLRDPDSFSARGFMWLDGKKENTYEVIMTYNARNGFGGMNNGMTVASTTVNKDTCKINTINFPIS